jgi:hypothetical protein
MKLTVKHCAHRGIGFYILFFYLHAGLVGGCSTLPSLVNRPALTTIFNTGATRLGRSISPLVESHSGRSGIYPLPDARDAVAARALLVQAAERRWRRKLKNSVDSRISATFTNYACRMTGSFIGSSNRKEKSCGTTLSLAPTFGSVAPAVRVPITDRVAIVILSR